VISKEFYAAGLDHQHAIKIKGGQILTPDPKLPLTMALRYHSVQKP